MIRTSRVFQPDVAIPPGETLEENLQILGLSQTELAERMGRPLKTINGIIKGKVAITPETAIQLEQVLGIPADFWNNLETNYRSALARAEFGARLESQAPLARDFPYQAMLKLGWVPPARAAVEKAAHLLAFFGTTDLGRIPDLFAAAYRVGGRRKPSPQALAAWLRKGELQARALEVADFNEAGLRRALADLRSLSRQRPDEALPRLVERCARVGVAVVLVPHLPGTYAQGSARWTNPRRGLVQLSLRYLYEDVFWFTVFHELGHLLHHGKKEVFIDLPDGQPTEEEKQADSFAAGTLIPQRDFADFKKAADFSAHAIRKFAQAQGIGPGIVIGRLQHEKLLSFATPLNTLRRQFPWRETEVRKEPWTETSNLA